MGRSKATDKPRDTIRVRADNGPLTPEQLAELDKAIQYAKQARKNLDAISKRGEKR